MKPQAAGHTRARPPRAPGSRRDGGVWPHPPPGSEAGEQPCGKSACPSSSQVTPHPLLLAPSFGRAANTNKTDRHFRQREDGACGRAQCRSLGMNTART